MVEDYQPQQPNSSLDAIQSATVHCTTCGYDLTGATIGGNCPECGMEIKPSVMMASALPASGAAITSMILGIVALTFSTVGLGCMCVGPIFGFPCAITGLVFWYVARGQIQRGEVALGSNGMNIAGLICSIIAMVISLAFIGIITISILNDL